MPGRFEDLVALIPVAGADRERIPVEVPFTGQPVASVPSCTADDVRVAVGRARAAQDRWQQVHPRRRADMVLRFHDLVLDRQSELLDLMQLETGKARRDALEEVLDVAHNARYYAFRAERWLAPERRHGALPLLTQTVELHRPYGVVGLINPWNYPFTLAASDALPALLAGNAVVLKPAEATPLTALRTALLFQEAGLPEGLLQVVTGRGEQVGPALIGEVDAVSFTGSTEVGCEIAAAAGKRLIPYSLELGGKNPMLVLEDAPLGRAQDGAVRGSFSNAGQLCISTERLYVHEAVFEPFLKGFVAKTRALRLGARFDFTADVGSLISQEQLDKTAEHVRDAVDKGARVVTGGRTRPDLGPYFYEPTILLDVEPGMSVFAEETFGPVVAVYRVGSPEEAIRAANSSTYGLNASVWTGNARRGRDIAMRLECGTVNVNDAYAAAWGSVDAPMGGMKLSGFGRRHGREGMFRYVEPQTIAVQHGFTAGSRLGESAEIYRQTATAALRLVRHLRLPGLG